MITEIIGTLRKGDTIEGDDILKALGVLPEDIQPGGIPAEVRLAGKIERELHRIGRFWTVQARPGCVAILSDHDALRYNQRRHRSGIRKFRRALNGMKGVDTRKFSAEDRLDYDQTARKISAQYLAIMQTRTDPTQLVQAEKIGR